MVAISLSGSGEGLGRAIARGYSTGNPLLFGSGLDSRLVHPLRMRYAAAPQVRDSSAARTIHGPDATAGAGFIHSRSFDQRLRPDAALTAIAIALRWPTRTTRRLPRVTPVYSRLRRSMT